MVRERGKTVVELTASEFVDKWECRTIEFRRHPVIIDHE